ncbi:MAG: hypothetical protein NT114_00035 [Patescibacteria group bacterium]|nr:hypothetical protein [Patescibacteria group bacterium]
MTLTENNPSIPLNTDNTKELLQADLVAIRQENKTEPVTVDNTKAKETETDQEIQRAMAHYGKEVLGGIDSLSESTEIYSRLQDTLQKSIKEMSRQVIGNHRESDQVDRMAVETAQAIEQAFRESKSKTDRVVKNIGDKSSENGDYQEYRSSLETDFLALEQAKPSQDMASMANDVSEKLGSLKTKTGESHTEIDQIISSLANKINESLLVFNNTQYARSGQEASSAVNALRRGVDEAMRVIAANKLAYRTQALDNENRIAIMQNDGARLAKEIAEK